MKTLSSYHSLSFFFSRLLKVIFLILGGISILNYGILWNHLILQWWNKHLHSQSFF
ncbi:hypothetical protein AAZX31_20G021200 [Glycine max]